MVAQATSIDQIRSARFVENGRTHNVRKVWSLKAVFSGFYFLPILPTVISFILKQKTVNTLCCPMFAFNKIYYYLCVNPINLEVEHCMVLGRAIKYLPGFFMQALVHYQSLAKVNVFHRK